MKHLILSLIVLASVPMADAQTYSVDWYVIGCGGGNSHSQSYSVDGAIGQPITGRSFSASYAIEGGFWVGAGPSGCVYLPGNANGVSPFNGIDVTFSVNYLKGLGPAPPDTCDCVTHGRILAAADANGNCQYNGIDISYSVNFLKGVGPGPLGCPDCPPPDRGALPPSPVLSPRGGAAVSNEGIYDLTR